MIASPSNGLGPLGPEDIDAGDCARCGTGLKMGKLRVPGHRVLADATCPQCSDEYFIDVPSSFALLSPVRYCHTQQRHLGAAILPFWQNWFDKMMEAQAEVEVEINLGKAVERPLLLHCLDPIFGHALKRLFHADAYMKRYPERPLIPLIAPWLQSFLPEGIAGAITVKWKGGSGLGWSRELDNRMAAFIQQYPGTEFCQTVPSLASEDIDISRFSGVQPMERSSGRNRARPTVCYVWRDTRCWGGSIEAQLENVQQLRRQLLSETPDMRFVVAGISSSDRWDDETEFLLFEKPGPEQDRQLNLLYSQSDVVIGGHGSNMILPSAHAGGTVELVPPKRWHNAWTASFFRSDCSPAEAVFYHRYLPDTTDIGTICDVVHVISGFAPRFDLLGGGDNTRFERVDAGRLTAEAASLPGFRP
ncbi:hypothetical protein [Thalassovita mangrovi]|uniref:Uncharacterized protein n=1 Tax=Thalassovita mangrovi TaxID=2692236 RepID=A0A6L8LR47_9RHOB|nr:hypothetical protein [Thalassovita mangrovi]MYM55962.1 hypothetical protein [Thalassovita mangrovi]